MAIMRPKPIAERSKVSAKAFVEEIYPAGEPVIMRGLVEDWPAIALARRSDQAIIGAMKAWDNGAPVEWLHGPADINGHYFYNADMTGLNFSRHNGTLTQALELMQKADGAAYSVQSTPIDAVAPGFCAEHRLPFLADAVRPRIWIGNQVIVQTHFDLSQNIACVVAGRRKFTLFPPEQSANLYMGPIEHTLAGTPVSLARLERPDFERFPRFQIALEHALTGELEPGDGIFIPYFWWHHVQSLSPFNVLVNYWWNEFDRLGSPMDALLHAILTLRDLPPSMKAPWKLMFDQFVFSDELSGAAHIPEHVRGGLGRHDPATRAMLWSALSHGVSDYHRRHFRGPANG